MVRVRTAWLAGAALTLSLCLPASSARANEFALDLDATLARAAEHSPDVANAHARIGDAEAERVAADNSFVSNPELEVEGGPRLGDDRTTELSVRLAKDFHLGGRRDRARAVADAGLVRARMEIEAAIRQSKLDAAIAYFDVLEAARLVDVMKASSDLAREVFIAAQARRKAGDITDLDVALTRIAAGRALSAIDDAKARHANAIGRLARALAIRNADTIVVRGELASYGIPRHSLPREKLENRADLRALAADVKVADAELRAAEAARRPTIGAWIGYEREEGANIVLGGVRIALPFTPLGRGERATARAHATRAAGELDRATHVAYRETLDAGAAYVATHGAVLVFEGDVLPTIADAEQLLARSLAAGQLTIAAVLVARDELLEARREHVERLAARARAWITLELAQGGVR